MLHPKQFPNLTEAEANELLASVGSSDPDFLLSLPYLPADKRSGALAILAFATELKTVPQRVTDPMIGAIRLQWWREAMSEVFEHDQPRKHPLVQALSKTIKSREELRPAFEEMIDKTSIFLSPGQISTASDAVDAFDVHAGGKMGLLIDWLSPEIDGSLKQALRHRASLHAASRAYLKAPTVAQNGDPIEGIETPTQRFLRSPELKALREELMAMEWARKQERIALPPDLSPVLIPLKWTSRSFEQRDISGFFKRLSAFKTVLNGR